MVCSRFSSARYELWRNVPCEFDERMDEFTSQFWFVEICSVLMPLRWKLSDSLDRFMSTGWKRCPAAEKFAFWANSKEVLLRTDSF